MGEPSRPPSNHILKHFVVLCSSIHEVIKICFLGKRKPLLTTVMEIKEKIKKAKVITISQK